VTSPYATGGGGFRFEDRVAAYYLACVLTETVARGLVGTHAALVLAQRGDLGHPLDDIIVEGLSGGGERTRLSLQLKSKLTFTPADNEWRGVVEKAWETVSADGFDAALDRVGAGIATINARSDSHYRPVLNWARYSASGPDFITRIAQPDFSHKDRTAFVEGVREIIAEKLQRAVTDDEIWTLLRSFVILRFDFQAEASSADEVAVEAQLQGYLVDADRPRAGDIWTFLVETASKAIPAAGSVDRARLLDLLQEKGLPTGVAPSRRADIAAIDAESRRALAEIRCEIGGLRLHRSAAFGAIVDGEGDGRFIQLVSEPGAGKSAILRELAEQHGRDGPLFVLKNDRIHPRGWPAHATTLGVTTDLPTLLNELASGGSPILFIDGIDRIADAPSQVTVNDIMRAIAAAPSTANWRIVVTVREQNLRHLGTWLDQNAIDGFGVRTVAVEALTQGELTVVGDAFPRLKPLLREGGGMDVVLTRPFFLDTIYRLSGSDASSDLPASEVELLDLWWSLGGADRQEFADAQRRRDALMQLADQAAQQSNRPIPIAGIDASAISELRSSGVIRDQEFGHSVNFAHDIYEEWSLCELLLRNRDRLPDFLKDCGEPQSLVRAVQLLGNHALEKDPSGDQWKQLYLALGAADLRPIWQRAVLTAPLHSTRTVDLLGKVEDFLLADDAAVLKRLLIALRTLEVVPNPLFLDANQIPDLPMDERVKMAQLAALPKGRAWVRFLDWLVPRLETLPATLIPHILPVLETWQGAMGGYRIRHCRAIGETSDRWLREFEEAIHPEHFHDRREPFGVRFTSDDERKIEKSLRALLLASAGDAPEVVGRYLDDRLADRRRLHMVRDQIIRGSGKVATFLPEKLVDFILAALIEEPEARRRRGRSLYDDDMHDLGIADHDGFYPASPLRMPFLLLLRQHEAQGLRLIHRLTNHATNSWRERQRRRGWTPLPVRPTFSWGRQSFWGDGQVYQWFRGSWAGAAVESALMALEQWSLERLDAGDDFASVLEKVISGSNSVASLGIGVSLSLAAQGKSVPASLPLVTCTHLWGWDIGRVVQDSTSMFANEIGDWHSYRHFLQAVRDLNRRPHRRFEIRALVPFYVFSEDRKLAGRYARAAGLFPKRLPFEVEEQRSHPDSVAGLEKRMSVFAQQAEPKNWRAVRSSDGQHFELRVEAPYLEQEEHKQDLSAHATRERHMGLSLWAQKTLDEGAVNDRFSIGEALLAAQALDAPDIFDVAAEGDDERYDIRMKASAVAGVAFVAARHLAAAEWTDEIGRWCFDVCERAATAPEPADDLNSRQAIQSMAPAVFATHGYSALLARGFETERCKSALLSLALDPIEAVAGAVHSASACYGAAEPDFLWAIMDLSLRQCLYYEGAYPDSHSIFWGEQEAERQLSLLDHAERVLADGGSAALADIPMPWLPLHPDAATEAEFVRNDCRFNYRLAQKTILETPFLLLLPDPRYGPAIQKMAAQLLDYTSQKVTPPFAESRREYRGNTPYEWVYAFSSWCGRLCAQLPEAEVEGEFLSRIFRFERDAGLMIMQSFMVSFMIEALLRPVEVSAEISEGNLALWTRMTDWTFEHPEWAGDEPDRHLDREYQACAFATLFCVARDFGPLICGVDPGWKALPRFRPIVERAIRQFGKHQTLFLAIGKFLQRGGIDLLPEPALEWLQEIATALKGDQEFWEANGDLLVDVLKAMIEVRPELSREHRETVLLVADILVDNGVRGAGFLQQELHRTAPA
jgi:hypothetical protein